MLDFLKKLFSRKSEQPKIFLGVLGYGEQDNLFDFKEVVDPTTAAVAAASASYPEKTPAQWRAFLSQFQAQSSACVAFTIAKIAQILYFLRSGRKIRFSPGWIYRQRQPKIEGMHIDNVIKLASQGMIPEELFPSENLNETEINSLPDQPYAPGVAEEFAIPSNWVNLPIDFDTIATSIHKTNKGVMLWFDFGPLEWFHQGIARIVANKKPWLHSVCAVDAIRYKGTDYLVIEDSADISSEFGHRKLVSRDFLKRRCLLARYPLSFKFDAQTSARPSYDGSVSSLQDCLTYEGVFPSNVTARGYFGEITRKAVIDFQKKYDIPMTGTVGPITNARLKTLYP